MSINKPQILIALVDDSGNILGYEEKLAVHERGDLHLAFSLMIVRRVDNRMECLLQRRALHKYHSGGLWTNTCCSHPFPNEAIKIAAQRRVMDELGIQTSLDILSIGRIRYCHALDNNLIEHELNNLLVAEVKDINWAGNIDEVMQVKWWKEQDIAKALLEHPRTFTAWFAEVFEHVQKNMTRLETSL
jgi:isopentenyl-diphosphate delta-isomerase